MAIPTQEEFWVRWVRYDRKAGGTITHACEQDTQRALCGAQTVEGAYDTLADLAGVVSCQRCMQSLRKRGVIPKALN